MRLSGAPAPSATSRPVLAAALAALLLAAGPAAPGPGGRGYEATDCAYLYAPLLADGAAVRRAVPPGFDVPGSPAAAVLVLAAVTCDVSVDGAPPRRTAFSDVGALLLPPGGESGIHLYLLWSLTDDPALGGLLADFGVAHEVLPGLRVATAAVGPATAVDAEAPGAAGGAYRAEAFVAGFHEATSGVVVWWHQGDLGTVRLDQAFAHDAAHGEAHGAAVVRAEGRLAALAGAVQVAEANLPVANLTTTVRLLAR